MAEASRKALEEKEALSASVRDLTAKTKKAAETIARLEEVEIEATEMRQTLTSNRDLIARLQTELQSNHKMRANDAALSLQEEKKSQN